MGPQSQVCSKNQASKQLLTKADNQQILRPVPTMAVAVGTSIIGKTATAVDHATGYFDELAPAALVSRAQTSPTQMGSTAVGAAVPRTASRSICQRGGPTSASAIVLDAYSQYSTPTSWDCGDLSCNARTILPGCFRMRAMSQQPFFATVCGTKKLDRALPNSQNF